jgi:hypothetical protein
MTETQCNTPPQLRDIITTHLAEDAFNMSVKNGKASIQLHSPDHLTDITTTLARQGYDFSVDQHFESPPQIVVTV